MKEKKIRVSMHSRLNNYETMLFLWASDPMEALEKLKPLIGKGGEYQLDGESVLTYQGKPIEREAIENV